MSLFKRSKNKKDKRNVIVIGRSGTGMVRRFEKIDKVCTECNQEQFLACWDMELDKVRPCGYKPNK